MERFRRDLISTRNAELCQLFDQIVCSCARECYCENSIRLDMLNFKQPRDATHQCVRLAGARACDNTEWRPVVGSNVEVNPSVDSYSKACTEF